MSEYDVKYGDVVYNCEDVHHVLDSMIKMQPEIFDNPRWHKVMVDCLDGNIRFKFDNRWLLYMEVMAIVEPDKVRKLFPDGFYTN